MVGLINVRNPSIGRVLVWANTTGRARTIRVHSPVNTDLFLSFSPTHLNFNDTFLMDDSNETAVVLGPGQSLYAIHNGGNNTVVELRAYVEAV